MHNGSKGREPVGDIEHEAPAAEVDSVAETPPTSTPLTEAAQPLALDTVAPVSAVGARERRIAAMLGAQPAGPRDASMVKSFSGESTPEGLTSPAAPESPTAAAVTGPSSARRDSTMPTKRAMLGQPASRRLPMTRLDSGESTPEGLTSPAAPESPTVAAVTGPSSAKRPSTMPGQRAMLGQPASRRLPVMARADSDDMPPILGRRLSAANTDSSIDESLLAAQDRHNTASVTATVALLQAVTADPTKLTPELWHLLQVAQQLHATLAASAAANMLAPQADTGPVSPPLEEFGGDRSGLRPGAHSPMPSEASTQPAPGVATVTAPRAMPAPPAPAAARGTAHALTTVPAPNEGPDVTTPQH